MHGYEKKLRYDTSHDMPLLSKVKQAWRQTRTVGFQLQQLITSQFQAQRN